MSELDDLRADLHAEQEQLDAIVAATSSEQWSAPTASPRWSVADQIGHLTYFDGTAALAITDQEAFRATVDGLMANAFGTADAADDFTLGAFRALAPPAQLAQWRANRALLDEAAATLREDSRIGWYGPSMGAKSFLTARLMEVWAHGDDIVAAIGTTRPATDRLRHIAQLGYITRGWSYAVRRETPPDGSIRLSLTSPSGATWAFGPDDATDTVTGSAEEFCLVVTQRANLADTALDASGIARHWLERAQAFAGPPSDVRPIGTRGKQI